MTNAFNFSCPQCGSSHLDVQALVWVGLTGDGSDADASHDGSHHWDDASWFLCRDCAAQGKAIDLDNDA